MKKKEVKLTAAQERALKELNAVYMAGIKCEVTATESRGGHRYTIKVRPNKGYTSRRNALLGGTAICRMLQEGMGGKKAGVKETMTVHTVGGKGISVN